jgi:hypothetical protein
MTGLKRILRQCSAVILLGSIVATAAYAANGKPDGAAAVSASSCRLGNGIEHIVHIQFDNVHLRRDNPNVPSDLEQMPNLLNFLEGQGTLLTNHHTPLISHTADDIITTLTGVMARNMGNLSRIPTAISVPTAR